MGARAWSGAARRLSSGIAKQLANFAQAFQGGGILGRIHEPKVIEHGHDIVVRCERELFRAGLRGCLSRFASIFRFVRPLGSVFGRRGTPNSPLRGSNSGAPPQTPKNRPSQATSNSGEILLDTV